MTQSRTFCLVHARARAGAIEAVRLAADGNFVLISEPTRTLEQNAKFHAICGELEKSGFKWGGKTRDRLQWKVLLVSGHAVATGHEAEVVEGLEGELINLRESTAAMGKRRGSSLIEYSIAFCAMNDIETNQKPRAEDLRARRALAAVPA